MNEADRHMNEAFSHALRAVRELKLALENEESPENCALLQRLLEQARSLKDAMLES